MLRQLLLCTIGILRTATEYSIDSIGEDKLEIGTVYNVDREL
jgi:hypothetical protein